MTGSTTRLALVTCLSLVLCGSAASAEMQVSHLYELSDFSGTIPYSDVLLHADRERGEVYATTGRTVRIFNEAGMEIFRFGDDWDLGAIYGLVVEPSGDIVVLTTLIGNGGSSPQWRLNRLDYRGEPIGPIDVTGLPAEYASFHPERMLLHDGELYLVSSGQLQVVVVDSDGAYRKDYDLGRLLNIESPETHDIFGISVDRSGNLLFTIPVLFKVFIVSPDLSIRQFGTPGSAAGKFGIVSGVATDDHGNYLVADKLRNVVMVFDSGFEVIAEIALSGRLPLVRPTDLVIGNSGRIYVTQAQKRGVSVFRLSATGELYSTPTQRTGATSETARRDLLERTNPR